MDIPEVYKEHIDIICESASKEIAPRMTASLAFGDAEEVEPLFDYVTDILKSKLKESMLQDMRKYGWKV